MLELGIQCATYQDFKRLGLRDVIHQNADICTTVEPYPQRLEAFLTYIVVIYHVYVVLCFVIPAVSHICKVTKVSSIAT